MRQNGLQAQFEASQSTVPTSVFFADSNGYAIVQHASDYSLVTPENPAHPGEHLIVYGVNLGPVNSQPKTGQKAPFEPLANIVNPIPFCRFNTLIALPGDTSVPAVSPSYVGLAPDTVGVYQVNFQLPPSVAVGDRDLVFHWIFAGRTPGYWCAPTSSASRGAKLPIR